MTARDEHLRRLQDLRLEIDGIDEEIVRLLSERAEAAMELATVKRALEQPLHDARREALVLAHVAEANDGPISDADIRSIYDAILAATRAVEQAAEGLR